ncbi:hypothetical protein phiA047_0142 [Aeromonas phage phiA047]|nr:hypothetical protein phiA047_0142 [Aeromonas phage phiA047]
MEIKLEQKVYPSGTVEINCRNCVQKQNTDFFFIYKYTVLKLRRTYKFEYSTEHLSLTPERLDVSVDSDLVENPKSITQYDWQLLRIIHPQVKSFQWGIFQILKDLVDNRVEEEYTLERIKSILQKENKIES